MVINYFWENWRYSNAPEGERPFEKVVGLTKYGVFAGSGMGIYDSIIISQTTGFWQTVNCLSFWVLPATAMCATFASVAYTMTKIRGKDGYLNYIIASIATGGVFYRWQPQCGPTAYHFTVVLMGLAMLKKHSDMNGYTILPLKDLIIRQEYSTFPIDLTIIKDPRGQRPWE